MYTSKTNMSEQAFESPESIKQEFIENTFRDGESMRTRLNEILSSNHIDPNEIKNSLFLDAEYGPEIIFANNPTFKEVVISEPEHPNGDIPEYTEEDDPLRDTPVHEIHKGILEKLPLNQRQKVQIHRDTADNTIKSFKSSNHSFDLVTRFNIFPDNFDRLDEVAEEMLSVTNSKGVVVITTLEGEGQDLFRDLSQKLEASPNVEKIITQAVKRTSSGAAIIHALGTFAIIIQKK